MSRLADGVGEDVALPETLAPSGDAATDAKLAVLFVSSHQMRQLPQTGDQHFLSWSALVEELSEAQLPRKLTGDPNQEKAQWGAWSPGLYEGGHRNRRSLIHASALVIDVDAGGDVDLVADLLEDRRAVVHATYKSTAEEPRCRIVLPFTAPVDPATYRHVADVVCAHLAQAGLTVDRGATRDPSRLSYVPVVRPGEAYRFRCLEGRALDAVAIVAANPLPRKPAPRPNRGRGNRRAYVVRALRSAVARVECASPGDRHATLYGQAFGLAREDLGLPDEDIVAALLPAFVRTAGEGRREEGERTIADAVDARRKGDAR